MFFLVIDFLLCYFISSSTLDVMSIGDIIYDLLWYQLPRNEQFIIQVIIQRSQIPFRLKGLGIIVCSLEYYLKVNYSLHMTK